MGKGLINLENKVVQYRVHHSNPANVLTQQVFVWPSFFATLLLFHFSPVFLPTPPVFAGLLPFPLNLNFAFFVVLAYAVFYFALDPVAGSIAAILCGGCFIGSGICASRLNFDIVWKVVLVIQVLSWTAQLIGHRTLEERPPLSLNNICQALFMAPFFLLFEVLQKVIGYEPYSGFNASVEAKIKANIMEWEAERQKKST